MRSLLVLGAMSLAMAACDAPAVEGPEARRGTQQAIVGGAASPASEDATVLINDRGRAVCSGSLIAPNLVLTARHCISEFDEMSECGDIDRDFPASRLTVSVGASATAEDYVARGVRLYVPDARELCSADIALLSLDNDVSGVTPVKVSFAGPAKNATGKAVGYGGDARSSRSDVKVLAVGPTSYTYRAEDGANVALDLYDHEIVTSDSICFGDSGGPLLDDDGLVVAVASRGDDDCRAPFWTTLGGHEKLIRDAAEAVGHPIIDTPAGGAPPSSKGPNAVSAGDDDDGATGSGGGSRKNNDNAGDEDDDGGASTSSAGCTTAPGSAGSPAMAMIGLALGLVTLRRAAGRSRGPSSPR